MKISFNKSTLTGISKPSYCQGDWNIYKKWKVSIKGTDVVDESEFIDIDRNLRVEDGLEHLDDLSFQCVALFDIHSTVKMSVMIGPCMPGRMFSFV